MAPRKKSFRSSSISTSEWLGIKPYDSISNYDLKYIGICNQVIKVLNNYRDFFQEARLSNEQVKILAGILVSHFEDFINEIGIWSAFRAISRELYGYPIPFYDLSGYSDELLNPEDIAFLIWAFCSTQAGSLFHGPDRPEILDMTDKIYDLLDAKIDHVPETDFYKKYFRYTSRPDFYELKKKLQWLALGSYFFGPVFSVKVYKEFEDPDEVLVDAFASDPAKLLYAIQESYLYAERMPLSAISAPEMLARLLDCPEEVRKDVLQFHRRPTAIFYLEEQDDQYYYLLLPSTGRVFPVRRDSTGHGGVTLELNHFHFASLIQWDGDRLITGIVFNRTVAEKDEKAETYQKERPDFGPKRFEYEKYFPKQKGIGMFFVPGRGIEMFAGAGELAGLLQADRELTHEEKSRLFFGLMSDHLSADSTQALLTYSDRNLAFSFPASGVDVRRDWPFLLRFFKPGDFGENLPNLSLISSEYF